MLTNDTGLFIGCWGHGGRGPESEKISQQYIKLNIMLVLCSEIGKLADSGDNIGFELQRKWFEEKRSQVSDLVNNSW
jgi:hypothetical protein